MVVVVSGYKDIEISSVDMLGCSYVKVFMFQGVPGSVYLGVRMSRCQVSGCWEYRCQDIGKCQAVGFYMSRFRCVKVLEC